MTAKQTDRSKTGNATQMLLLKRRSSKYKDNMQLPRRLCCRIEIVIQQQKQERLQTTSTCVNCNHQKGVVDPRP